ncbi:hypothetical protein CULT_1190002 [[Clostridium] ultunense Esp]|nr:hypothetical protein CULT_1190002 [[Clostridium] ultunense Esp]
MQHQVKLMNDETGEVSILTQPVGWVQRDSLKLFPGSLEFQSSPSLLAGCNDKKRPILDKIYDVSILTQPVGWVQHRLYIGRGKGNRVSILTQPVGWVQQRRL